MHYKNKSGQWRRINPAFAAVENGWMSNANSLSTGVAPRNSRANVTLAQSGVGWEPRSLQVVNAAGQATVLATMLGDSQAVTGTLSADQRTLVYPASWSDAAIQDQWQSDYGRAEYSLRLSQKPETLRRFAAQGDKAESVELRVSLHLLPGTRIYLDGQPVKPTDLPLEMREPLAFVSEQGETLWLQPPQAYEQGHPSARVAGSYQLSAGADASTIELSARIPYAWLTASERQFPVVLDPVFQVKSPTTAKVAFYSNAAQTTFGGWLSNNPIGLGQYPDGVTRAFLRFEMPTMPSDIQIDAAYLEVLPNNGFISCAYNVALPEVCWGDGPRAGLGATVGLYKLTGPDNWWSGAQVPYPAAGDPGTSAHMYWSTSEGGYNTRWNITPWVQEWQYRPNNQGVMLKLAEEFCYQDTKYLAGSSSEWMVRSFTDGCGVFDIQNPTAAYDPTDAAKDFAATTGGIRLVVTYTGPTLAEGVILPVNDPNFGNPSVGDNYYQAAHEYVLNGYAAAYPYWQAAVARGKGSTFGQCPTPNGTVSMCGQNLDGSVLLDLRDTQDNLLTDDTGSGSLSYVLLNRRTARSSYRLWVNPNETDSPSNAYDIRLIREQSSIQVELGTPTVIEGSFDTHDPLGLWNLVFPANTHNRVDVEITGHNHRDTINGIVPGTYDYASKFSLQLFAAGSGYKRANDTFRSASVTPSGTPLVYGEAKLSSSIFDTSASASYALALAYAGPSATIYTCTTAHEFCTEMTVVPLEFTYRVRVTSCAGDTFPTRGGQCQKVECPTSGFPAAYHFPIGSFELWSKDGWTDQASNAGVAPMIGPAGGANAPTVAIIGGKLSYAAQQTLIDDSDSTVMLVQCEAPANNHSAPVSTFAVYDGKMRSGTTSTNLLLPTTWALGNTTFNPWQAADQASVENNFVVNPPTGRVVNAATVQRKVGATLEFIVQYSADATGWPSLTSLVYPANVATPPPVAGVLALDLGDSFSMDTKAAAGKDTARKFQAIRALDATISQPANMGGASKPVRAIIVGPEQKIEGQPCTNGVNCLDVRAPDDVYPGTPKRDWQMPDIHVTGSAGLVMLDTPGELQAWSVDHPAMANSPQAVSQNFSFDTFGAAVSIVQEKCDPTDTISTQVIRGETQMALPMIGDDGSSSSNNTMVAARFKLCGDPDVALRMVEFEFRSPIGVPVGSTGLFVYGMKGTVTIKPENVNITFAMDFYFGDSNTLQGTGKVTIDTQGYFEFSGTGKILGTVDATGKLWVAWNPLDTGFVMSLHYGLGSIASLDGTVRAHAWRGQGWQNKYTWLPNNPEEDHFAAQISASFVIYEGAVIDMWPLVIPPVDLSRSLEIAFGQFCTNSNCSAYEWGIKAALSICGYSVGVYYGFDHGVDLILGNDGHTLIDQYGGATAQASAETTGALFTDSPQVRVEAAPQAVNGDITIPFTVTANTEEFLVGLGWQAGDPEIKLYNQHHTLVVSNTVNSVFISDTERTKPNFGTVGAKLIGVQFKQPGSAVAGVWHAVISNVAGQEHLKFAFLANKGAPGTPEDRGQFTAPGADDVNGTGSYTLRWPVDADAPISTTIGLYYHRYYQLLEFPYTFMQDISDMPIAQHLPYNQGQYTWNTISLKAACAGSSGHCYYRIRAVVDDGVNDLPDGEISDSGNFCEPCSNLPSERAFDTNRFPGTSTFTSIGRIWVTDSTAPATPTGLAVTGVAGALLARWNPNTDKDLAAYLVEWGKVVCTMTCSWIGGAPTHAERIAPVMTPTLRIGGVMTEGLGLGQAYGVVVSAIDVNDNTSPRSAIDNARPGTSAAAQAPSAPLTPTLTLRSSTSTMVEWTSKGIPDHYRLVYRQVTSATVMQRDNIPAIDHTGWRTGYLNLTGLETGATYEAWVTAANSDDWHSAYSPPISFTVTNGVDADDDGAPDDWESAHNVSIKNALGTPYDTDRDGLYNLSEYRNGTDPRRQDSDNDGFTDWEETDAATNPLDNSVYPAEYTQLRLTLKKTRVDFYAKQGMPAPSGQLVYYIMEGTGSVSGFEATSTSAWISPTLGIFAIPDLAHYVSIKVDTTGLAPGDYQGVVRVDRPSMMSLVGGPYCIRVNLHVLPADADLYRHKLYLPLVRR